MMEKGEAYQDEKEETESEKNTLKEAAIMDPKETYLENDRLEHANNRFNQGKLDGAKWCKRAHFRDIAFVLDWHHTTVPESKRVRELLFRMLCGSDRETDRGGRVHPGMRKATSRRRSIRSMAPSPTVER